MNSIELRIGSCLDENNYPEDPVDLILFDPPFWPFSRQYTQIRTETKHSMESIPTPTSEEYPQWWEKICQLAQKHLKSSGWFCHKSDSWMGFLSFPITTLYFQYSNEVIWDKERIGLGRRIRTQHEKILCYMSQLPGKKYWKYQELPTRKRTQKNLEGKTATYRVDGWHGSSKGIAFPSLIHISNFNNGTLGQETTTHINETPPEVWSNFIEYMCPPDGIVLDLTMGLGSIGEAVLQLNRRIGNTRQYWGIEIIEKYVAIARSKLLPNTMLSQYIIKAVKQ